MVTIKTLLQYDAILLRKNRGHLSTQSQIVLLVGILTMPRKLFLVLQKQIYTAGHPKDTFYDMVSLSDKIYQKIYGRHKDTFLHYFFLVALRVVKDKKSLGRPVKFAISLKKNKGHLSTHSHIVLIVGILTMPSLFL